VIVGDCVICKWLKYDPTFITLVLQIMQKLNLALRLHIVIRLEQSLRLIPTGKGIYEESKRIALLILEIEWDGILLSD